MIGGVILVLGKIITSNYRDDSLTIIRDMLNPKIININLKDLVGNRSKDIKLEKMDSIGPTTMAKDSLGNLLLVNSWDDSLFKIDLEGMELLDAIKVGRHPTNIKLYEKKIYILNSDSRTLSLVDEGEFVLIESISLGGKPVDLQIDELNGYIYIANYDNYSINKIDIGLKKIKNIPLNFQPLKMIIQGDFVFVLSFLNGGPMNYSKLSKIDINKNKIISSMRIRGAYYDFIKFEGRDFFALIDSQNSYLYELDLENKRINREIYLGGLPNRIISDGKYLYINDLLNDQLIILNALNYKIRHRIRVGKEPQGIFLL